MNEVPRKKSWLKIGCIALVVVGLIGGLFSIIGLFSIGKLTQAVIKNEQAYFDSLPVLTGRIFVEERLPSPLTGDSAAWIFWVWDYQNNSTGGSQASRRTNTGPGGQRQIHLPGKGLSLEVAGKRYPLMARRGFFQLDRPARGAAGKYHFTMGIKDSVLLQSIGYDRMLTGMVESIFEVKPRTQRYSRPDELQLVEYFYQHQQEVSLYAKIVGDTVRLYP